MTTPDTIIVSTISFIVWAGTCVVAWGMGRVQGYDKGFATGHAAGYSLAWNVFGGGGVSHMLGSEYTDADGYSHSDWEEEAPVDSLSEGEVANRPRAEAQEDDSDTPSNVLFFNNANADKD